MGKKLDITTKSKVNHLFFVDNKTTKQIADKLNLEYSVVLRAIDRKNFYNHDIRSIGNNKADVDIIKNEVLNYFNIPNSTLQKKSRLKDSLTPRQMTHNLIYDLTNCSEAFIGKEIGSLNACTVHNSRDKMKQLAGTNKRMDSTYQYLEETCRIKLKQYRDEQQASTNS